MTEPVRSDLTRYAKKMNHAIDLAKAGNFAQALDIVSRLVEEFGEAASGHGYLAWFLLELGRHKEAIQHSRQAIALAPNSENASLIHFQVLWQSGKQIEALDEMKRFLTIRPSKLYTELICQWKPDLEDL
jgi:tetratricopeptide (TPR) repeat protein